MANHLKNFKKNKKSKFGQRKQTSSHSYQRYRDQVRNSTSPGSVTSPTGNHASSSFQPVLHVHGSDHRSAPETPVSREPPAPRFLVEAHALWQAYSSVRESNPLSGRVALYRAGWLHAKYVLHVPDPPLDYCFALEEVRFLETLQTIENQQQSGQHIRCICWVACRWLLWLVFGQFFIFRYCHHFAGWLEKLTNWRIESGVIFLWEK